jgi:class 3 adenylate cyclase
MQAIADWLEKLGMSEYAQRFVENRIDLSVLPELTDQDLEKLGVVLGDRRKILRAIANLGNAPPAAASAPAASVQPIAVTTAVPASEAAGERRHVTVMFCDLVDSTGIAARLDAEEWRDLVGAYLAAASAAVTDMGGKVAKKLGDGLMALFGHPVAQENDAERAVRAALAIQRALAELNRKNADTGKPALAARIAIDSGPVVIDASGEIFGDVPNVAARAHALAEPGAVVVTARVQRQVAGLFVAEERGSHELKGVPEPVTLYRIVRASGGGRRAAQRHLTPLVGRDEEIAMLMRRWERARQGDGQLVLIGGEPGLGKSRLIEEFHTRLRDVPHTERRSAQHEIGAGELHIEPRGFYSDQRLDGRSFRYAPRVCIRDRPLHAWIGSLWRHQQHPSPGRLPHPARLRRRYDGAGGSSHLGADVREIRAHPRHELRRYPGPDRPNARADRRRSYRRLSTMALNILRESSSRHRRPRSGLSASAGSSGCVTRPKGQEIGSTGYAGPTQRSLLIGHCVMATAEHREPCDSRGSCTVLGAPRGEIPPGDSTFTTGWNH